MNDVRQETFGETCWLGFFFTIYLTRKRSLESAWSANSALMILIFLSMGNPSRFTMTRFLTFFYSSIMNWICNCIYDLWNSVHNKTSSTKQTKNILQSGFKNCSSKSMNFWGSTKAIYICTCTKYPYYSAWKLNNNYYL